MTENQTEIVTVTRVLVYKGPREWVQRTILHSLIMNGVYTLPNQATITSTVTENPDKIELFISDRP